MARNDADEADEWFRFTRASSRAVLGNTPACEVCWLVINDSVEVERFDLKPLV
jgi:hypothetical protein